MRDQLRDRRTLFTIAVLPIVLYPLVGTLLLQVAQFTQRHQTSVCVIGTDHLANAPVLLVDGRFSEDFAAESDGLKLITYQWDEVVSETSVVDQASRWVREGAFDTVMVVPPTFAQSHNNSASSIQLLHNIASDESVVARERMSKLIENWRNKWIHDRLAESGIDVDQVNPFSMQQVDVAPESTREAALWSKLLPFVMLIWAMTGAFYPAIDLVAGEKERGTLETLLCSPAYRSEIVFGKLAAVTTFSMLTAILNAGSMLVTSSFVMGQIGVAGVIGTPPLAPMLWLLVALIPLSTLFSALALGVAAMAKSSKEGQYYLMPLMMVTIPLVMLPMLPGTTLGIGTSLIPVTGMFLMVRSLVEGQYVTALMYLPFVAAVTFACLWMATQWVQRQFESEAVLFGGSEQWELRSWVRHLWRDRQPAATTPQGLACGAVILVALFFGKLAVTEMPSDFAGIAKLILTPQLAFILTPTLLMAVMLTTSLRQSLRICMPHWTTLPLAMLFGLCFHPIYMSLASWITELYPVSEQASEALKPFAQQIASAPWLTVILLMAVLPAVCEELAFRGFIFGGLERDGNWGRAIVVTAVMFGLSHGVLQQSIAATFMGMVLGWVAYRTGSVLPGILLHFTNNAMSVSMGRIAESNWGGKEILFRMTENGPQYQPLWMAVSVMVVSTLIWYFATLPNRRAFGSEKPVVLEDRLDSVTSLAGV